MLGTVWGKYSKSSNSMHPAFAHMLDVAAVAHEMLLRNRKRVEQWRKIVVPNNDSEQFTSWLVFLVALHDIGKLTPGFQYKCPALCTCLGEAFASNDIERGETDHGMSGYAILSDLFASDGSCEHEIAKLLGHILAAHHGRFYRGMNFRKTRARIGQRGWQELRQQAVEELLAILGLRWDAFPFAHSESLPAGFLLDLAGLTTLADWLGSDENRFGYVGEYSGDWDQYFRNRCKIAAGVSDELHLTKAPAAEMESRFTGLFEFDIPNSSQKVALNAIRQLTSPSLLIIETPMGSGKTEAALAVSDICMRERGARGIYYALPTQATANQIFGRMHDFLKKNKAIDETELHLIHAYAPMQKEYRELQLKAVYDGEAMGDVMASSWFAARKRGLLAPFAVGTVDQALMGAMRTKHMFLRLHGLAGKVVIIDEVHAYDAYTSTLVDNLVSWLAAVGATVILLSATLPPSRRAALLSAYSHDAVLNGTITYPCVMGVDVDGHIISAHVPWPDDENKTIFLKRVEQPSDGDWSAVATILSKQLTDGGCAACILNTVSEAQSLFRYLSRHQQLQDAEMMLFHARFPIGERLAIEKRLERMFGKPGKKTNRPHKAVVVATQVLEQSLDVDFDIMVSAHAPVDLLLQRAGRLQRHKRERPPMLSESHLYLLSPDLENDEPNFGASEYVYNPVVLLKSALALADKFKEGKGVTLPGDVQPLIETVYEKFDIVCPERLQPWLEDKTWEGRTELRVMKNLAVECQLPFSTDGERLFELLEQNNDYYEEDAAEGATRLGRPAITLIVLHEVDERCSLLADGTDPVTLDGPERLTLDAARELLLHSVAISDQDWYRYFKDEVDAPQSWQRTPLLSHCRPAVFRNGGLHHQGRLLRISPALGLEIIGKGRKG